MLCFFFFGLDLISRAVPVVSTLFLLFESGFGSIAVPFGDAIDELEAFDRETLERLERAERAIDRMLLVSESRGAEVGARFLGVCVAPLEVCDKACPFVRWPLVYGSDGEDDDAEAGERSSGVEERVLVSVTSAGL